MRACVLSVWIFLDNLVSGGVLNDVYRLDIVHYNDFHARFEETSVSYPMCATNNSSCLGGFARLYYEIQELLKEKPGALLLNAGDTFQGSYWYTLLKWNVTQEFINMLPNDAHAIGNHEFDDGIAGIVPYLAALRAPVLAANIDTTNEPSLKGLYKPHVIIKRKERQIGIIGLITPETMLSSRSEGVIFLDPIQVVYKEAQLLTDEGVDIIIVLSHCGLEVDKEIAKTVGKNIDVIVGGHSHSLLWNGESPSKEYISGPYPVLVETQSTDHKSFLGGSLEVDANNEINGFYYDSHELGLFSHIVMTEGYITIDCLAGTQESFFSPAKLFSSLIPKLYPRPRSHF